MHVSVLFQVYTDFSSNLRTYCGHGVCKQQVILSFCNWRTRLPLMMSLWSRLLLWFEPRRAQNPINGAPDWSVVVSGPRAIYPPRDGLSDSWNVCVDHTTDQGPPLNILIFFHGYWPETSVTTDSINWSHACCLTGWPWTFAFFYVAVTYICVPWNFLEDHVGDRCTVTQHCKTKRPKAFVM